MLWFQLFRAVYVNSKAVISLKGSGPPRKSSQIVPNSTQTKNKTKQKKENKTDFNMHDTLKN